MNFAISDSEFNKENNFSYEDFNQFLFNKVMESHKVCDYYIADFGYNNEELTEVFYLDTNKNIIYWLNDWFEGGTIKCLFGFVDSTTVGDYAKHYLWRNRYRGCFDYESNHN